MKNCTLIVCLILALLVLPAFCLAQADAGNASALTAASTTAANANTSPTSPAAPSSSSSNSSSSTAGIPQLQTRDPRYRIAASDTFDLTFPLAPEYNQLAVAVQPDGFVTLYGIGDVKVQGLTVPELTETVRTAYEKILHDPLISIVLKDFNKPYFIADGQVTHPGKYDLRADTTLTQAVAIAGGFTEYAKHSHVVLFRRTGNEWGQGQIFDIKKMEGKANLAEDPYLHPGDLVFVPKNTLSKIKDYMPTGNAGAYYPIK